MSYIIAAGKYLKIEVNYILDIDYCYKQCTKGKAEGEKLLNYSDSVFDAAFDFNCFIEICLKTCPYKQAHKNKNPRSFNDEANY